MIVFFSWVSFAATAAITDAAKNVFAKKGLENFDPIVIAWITAVYTAIVVAPFMFIRGVPAVDQTFLVVIFARTILDSVAMVLYMYAIKNTDLSLAIPTLALTPVFLIFVEFFVTGDLPSAGGFIGIVLVVFGAYLLNRKTKDGLLSPFKAIFTNRGVFLMFCVAIIWSFTSVLHRIGIEHSNSFFYAGVGAIALVVALTPIALYWNRAEMIESVTSKSFFRVAPAGILDGIAFLAQMVAQGMTLASYVIAVKRTSILFSAIFGKIFFNEKLAGRILPIFSMLIGIFLIIFL